MLTSLPTWNDSSVCVDPSIEWWCSSSKMPLSCSCQSQLVSVQFSLALGLFCVTSRDWQTPNSAWSWAKTVFWDGSLNDDTINWSSALTDEIFSLCWINKKINRYNDPTTIDWIFLSLANKTFNTRQKRKDSCQIVTVRWWTATARASRQDWRGTIDDEWSERRDARIADRHVVRVCVGTDVLTIPLISRTRRRRLSESTNRISMSNANLYLIN